MDMDTETTKSPESRENPSDSETLPPWRNGRRFGLKSHIAPSTKDLGTSACNDNSKNASETRSAQGDEASSPTGEGSSESDSEPDLARKSLSLHPLTLKEACAFVARVHRHHRPPQGGLFAIGCAIGGEVAGVVIIGRPVSRMLDDGWTAEVTRLATDGSRNACSMLYSAAWRACRAMGYRKLVTYILDTEPGTSLSAAGWKCVGEAGGGKWSRGGRPRVDLHPTQGKLRFEITSPSPAARQKAGAA